MLAVERSLWGEGVSIAYVDKEAQAIVTREAVLACEAIKQEGWRLLDKKVAQ